MERVCVLGAELDLNLGCPFVKGYDWKQVIAGLRANFFI